MDGGAQALKMAVFAFASIKCSTGSRINHTVDIGVPTRPREQAPCLEDQRAPISRRMA